MNQSSGLMRQSGQTLEKLDAFLDEVAELFERLESGGVEIVLNINGHPMPVTLQIKPAITEDTPQ
jgi:DNA-binding protein YbaB